MSDDLEALVAEARDGSRDSLERLVERLQRPVYNLALRMLWHPEDARDASQEILVRVVTHLGSFRGESGVLTWVYRIAANYLISARHSRAEEQGLTFRRFAEDLAYGLAHLPAGTDEWPADKALLLEEVKVGCMQALLTCLDRPHRLAYILGEILELEGPDGARILNISATAFRKRLSRRARRSPDSPGGTVVWWMKRTHVDASDGCRARRRPDESMLRPCCSGGPSPRRPFLSSWSEYDASSTCSGLPRSIAPRQTQTPGLNCSNGFGRPSIREHSVRRLLGTARDHPKRELGCVGDR